MPTMFEMPVPVGESVDEQSTPVFWAVVETATGRITRGGSMPKFMARMQLRRPDVETLVLSETDIPLTGHYYDIAEGRVVGLPTPPSEYHQFDYATKSYVYSADVKQRIWEVIKAERERRMAAGVELDNMWFNTDQMSRTKYQTIAAGQDNVPGWRTMDNVEVTMTPEAARRLLAAITQQDSQVFAAAAALRTLVDASENPATLLSAGEWPITHKSFAV